MRTAYSYYDPGRWQDTSGWYRLWTNGQEMWTEEFGTLADPYDVHLRAALLNCSEEFLEWLPDNW